MTSSPRLLVTGAGGSIGRRLRSRLDSQGYDASYVVSGRSANATDHPAVDVADVADVSAMDAILAARKPSVIIHLASVVGAECERDPERAERVNVDATRSLAALAAEHRVSRIVLASTSAVYGDQFDSPVGESGPLVLGSRYAQTKRSAEQVLEAAAGDELTAVALRIFNVFGPGMHDSLANRLIASTADDPVTLAGLDTFVRDYVHVDDVVEALATAALVPVLPPWVVVNIAGGRPTSNRQLVAALEPVSYAVGAPRSSYSCASVDAAKSILGFAASRPLSRASVATGTG